MADNSLFNSADNLKKKNISNLKATFKRLVDYISLSKKVFFWLLFMIFAAAFLDIIIPVLWRFAIDAVAINTLENTSVDFAKLGVMTALLIFSYILISVLTFLKETFLAKLSESASKKMRDEIFLKIVTLPVKFIDSYSSGELLSLITNDTENISLLVSKVFPTMITAIIIFIGSLFISFSFSPLMTIIFILIIFSSFVTSGFLGRFIKKYSKEQQSKLGELNSHIKEMIIAFHTVTAFNGQANAIDKFDEINKKLKKSGVKTQLICSITAYLTNVFSYLGFFTAVVLGGILAFKGIISIGTVFTFVIYTKLFSRSIKDISDNHEKIISAFSSCKNVFEIFDAYAENENSTIPFFSNEVKGDISFCNVNFSYPSGKAVLKNFCLDIKSGEKIAFVGSTGAGKTTIINLLSRFYDADSGTITVDGNDIKLISLHELRHSIGAVMQDAFLFSGTVEDNIMYGRFEAELDEMEDAAALSGADKFILNLPDDYRTAITNNGECLSAGQRQLIAISRAVMSNPPILIFDEATSSVDTLTELFVQSAMVKFMKNRTCIIIAHRLSTIRDADRIVVIENGDAAEIGTHDELVALGGIYHKLYMHQFEGLQT